MSENNFNIEFSDNREERLSSESSHHSHHHSAHHHTHHHSSHSRRRKRRNSKSEKAKAFLKRNRFKIANIVIAVMFVTILIVLAVFLDKEIKDSSDIGSNNGITLETNAKIGIEIPLYDEDIVIAGTAVKKFMSPDNTSSVETIYKNLSSSGRLDTGLPVTISYAVTALPDGVTVESADVFVSQSDGFTDCDVYSFGDETSVDIYHLFVNTQYYYRVSLELSNGLISGAQGSFRTAGSPRVLSVDGVANIRDIGGWETLDGKTVRQGLLYRSAEIDGAVNSKYRITQNGINTMHSVFGIRTEMDLRHSSDNPDGVDMLGNGVEHIYYGAPMYNEAFSESGKEKMKNIFKDLADEDNYPVLLHCTHGMDRTGTVCYILEALLGMSEADMMKEYQLSGLYHGSLWAESEMSEFVGQLKSYEGDTIRQKAENYLLSIGVTPQEISEIRRIYLG